MQYLLLVAGFVLLIKGADFFVDGSSGLAKRLKVPSMIIGLTVVAMGTSLPETSVSVSASLQGKNDLAISNAVGSNIFNLMVVCGVTAIITPLFIKKESLRREFPFSILCAAVLMVFGLIGGEVNRIEGIVLLLMFGGFLAYTVISAKKARNAFAAEKADDKIMPMWQCLLFIVCGGTAIAFGGRMVVNSASEIARSFGLSDNVIGLTIVALGTSLPELFTSIVAAKHGEVDIALGNVIGSNIFNILFVLGIATTISPISFMMTNTIDCIALIAMSLIVMIFCWTKQTLQRWEGAVMAAAYTAYIVYITLR
ncbi:cation:H+ antiporter [Ruminococcaceae bacterium FB2012]|nr:cation:H+ antiporter [Ruminococcaceae bacterium FB2012]